MDLLVGQLDVGQAKAISPPHRRHMDDVIGALTKVSCLPFAPVCLLWLRVMPLGSVVLEHRGLSPGRSGLT